MKIDDVATTTISPANIRPKNLCLGVPFAKANTITPTRSAANATTVCRVIINALFLFPKPQNGSLINKTIGVLTKYGNEGTE